MGYRVTTDVFEGPLDLLLHLVSRHKVDVADISVSSVAHQYMSYLDEMRELDLDIASEFLLVASTLLEMKAAGLLPEDETFGLEDFEDVSPLEARRLLVERLLAYKQFKNAASELSARLRSVSRQHARYAGLEEPFLKLMPDFLEHVTLSELATLCAELERRREVFLLQAEHIASRPVSVDLYMERVMERMRGGRETSFSKLMEGGMSRQDVVGLFLAVLELYKRERIAISQETVFGDIALVAVTSEED